MSSSVPETISDELITEITSTLAGNQQLRRKLPHHGVLHIDRQLPFLCVYRRPLDHEDEGTASLLFGQSSYLITSAEPSHHDQLNALLQAIARTQKELFGRFMIVEIWAGGERDNSNHFGEPPEFDLYAPKHHVPGRVMDSFENILQRITMEKQRAKVRVHYGKEVSPKGLPPLLTIEQLTELDCLLLSLRIKPVYQDSESGESLPFALRSMKRKITRALKKAFYTFSHYCTPYRPAHYHELGQRAITKSVWECDKRLAEISENFDLLLHVTPVNVSDAWRQFEERGFNKVPEFHYRPRNADPTLLKRKLYHIPVERIGDPTLSTLFASKRDELDRQLTLINDRNKEAFLYGSMQLFGEVDDELLANAKKIISAPMTYQEPNCLSAEEFAQRAREEVVHYRKMDPSFASRVEVRDDISGIMVSHGNFLIGSDARVAAQNVGASLNHEIGTHALTYHNGKKQPFQQLYAGLAGYEELQEGLAVLAEFLCGELNVSRLRMLAGRVVAVASITSGAGFIETFEQLRDEYGYKPYTSFLITMRVYRGGGYTKDMIYLRGLLNLIEYLEDHDDFDLLLCGKIALNHLPLLHELRWREVIKPLALTPRYLKTEQAQQRLSGLRKNPTLDYIMEML